MPSHAQRPASSPRAERVIAEFLNYIQVEKRLSRNTAEAYERDLRRYAGFLAERGLDPAGARRTHVQEYLGTLYRAHLDSRSIARSLSTLRGFYRQLLRDGVIAADPTLNLDSPKTWKMLPKYLALEDVDRLLAAPDRSRAHGARNGAMLDLLYATGLRVSELVSLRLADLHADEGYLQATGKGNKQRLVPVGRGALRSLAAYLSASRAASGVRGPGDSPVSEGGPRARLLGRRSSSYLFVTNRGTRMTRQCFWQIISACGRRAGIRQRITPHLLRHSFITNALRGGMNPLVLARIAGHSSLRMIDQVYSHLNTSDSYEAMLRLLVASGERDGSV